MIRVGVLGAPLARPLDFAEAYLGTDLQAVRSECEEHGAWRVFVVELTRPSGELRLTVSIAPRRRPGEAFAAVLEESDAAVVLVGAGGWREQEPVLAALAEVRAAGSRSRAGAVPLVHVVNDFVPPRLDLDPRADELEALLGAERLLRGRLCWWRHERTGTELAREAVDQAIAAAHAAPR